MANRIIVLFEIALLSIPILAWFSYTPVSGPRHVTWKFGCRIMFNEPNVNNVVLCMDVEP